MAIERSRSLNDLEKLNSAQTQNSSETSLDRVRSSNFLLLPEEQASTSGASKQVHENMQAKHREVLGAYQREVYRLHQETGELCSQVDSLNMNNELLGQKMQDLLSEKGAYQRENHRLQQELQRQVGGENRNDEALQHNDRISRQDIEIPQNIINSEFREEEALLRGVPSLESQFNKADQDKRNQEKVLQDSKNESHKVLRDKNHNSFKSNLNSFRRLFRRNVAYMSGKSDSKGRTGFFENVSWHYDDVGFYGDPQKD